MAAFPVVLDACVLYPIIYRDFLLFANLLGRKPPFTPDSLVQVLAEKTPGFAFGLAEALEISM
ncbi:MAG: hypothetical protein HY692_07145 [Cyanobacteria bacterium NC_groundwater_1444_Ag_S-0.65um_54_12]|nr:hypothetical protein [Cyanobacteria bacterium NC_groundwater_1444_Ag_S-0.65um_54_12]